MWAVIPASSFRSANTKLRAALRTTGFSLVEAETERLLAKFRREKQSGNKPAKMIVSLARLAMRTGKAQFGDYYRWTEEQNETIFHPPSFNTFPYDEAD